MEQSTYYVLNTIGTFLVAFATIFVAFVGVWFARYLERRARPRLELVYERNDDNKYLPPESTHDGSEEVWIKVRVNNASNVVARDVELRLLSLKREGSWDNRPSWWFKVSNLNMTHVNVPPMFPQPFDIAHVKNVTTTDDDLGFYLTLVTPNMADWPKEKMRIEVSEDNKLFPGGRYTAELVLACSNADPRYYAMQLNVLGRDRTDPLPKGIIGPAAMKKRVICELLGESRTEKQG